MSDSVTLNTFPKNECEALAMLYVQNQDLSGFSPEELYDKYRDTYDKIYEHRKAVNRERHATKITNGII